MNKLNLNLFDSILAGLAIGIAGLIYLSIYPWSNTLAALCFSIGLIIVIVEEYHLFTGKIAYIEKYKHLSFITCLIGNICGVGIMGLMAFKHPMANILVESKLSTSLIEIFFKAIGCGFLMYVATHGKTFPEKILRAIICVFAFIMAEFEHSIANTFYFIAAGRLGEIRSILVLLISVVGNTIGAILGNYKGLISLFKNKREDNDGNSIDKIG